MLALSCVMSVVCVSSYGDWGSLNISVRQSSMDGIFDCDCVPVTEALPIRTVRQLLMLSLSSDRTAWLSCSVEQPHEINLQSSAKTLSSQPVAKNLRLLLATHQFRAPLRRPLNSRHHQ